MRYVVLLVLCGLGVLLFAVARIAYQDENADLAGKGAAIGTVSAVGSNGDLTIKYQFAAKDYEIVRNVPLNYFPTIRSGDAVPLIVDAVRPDTATVRHWSEIHDGAAVCAGFGGAAFIVAICVFLMMGSSPVVRKAMPTGAVTLNRSIYLQNTKRDFYTTLVFPVLLFGLAFLAYRHPYFLWRPWITYIAMGAMVILGIGLIWVAFDNKALLIHADPNGFDVKDTLGTRRFAWEDVATLKRKTITQTERSEFGTDSNPSVKVMSCHLLLFDRSGKEMMRLDEDTAMEPYPDWLLLRAYIPERTGLPIAEERTENPLGNPNLF